MEGRHATAASDVYSLGVVLYELLTGRSPYRPRSREPLDVVEAVRGTRAELNAVTAEIMQLVGQLDALNRFRFKNDAEAFGAWRSARNVAWPLNERGEGAPEDGTVRPAA